MGSSLGWRKQGSQKEGDVEANTTKPAFLSSSPPIPRRSASESCFSCLSSIPGSSVGQVTEEEPVMRSSQTLPSKSRCRQVWAAHSTHVLFSFLAGILLSYLAFTFSLGVSRSSTLNLPKVIEASMCDKTAPPGIALSPLALQKQNGSSFAAVPDRLIVAARHFEDTSWLDTYLSDIPHVVYQVDDPENTKGAQHATLANKGNEAMAYLQFIIDYYDRLPPSMAFLHGHRSGWHMLDIIPILQRLRWGHLGYAPLRYKNSPGERLDWKCGSRTDDAIWKQFDCNWEGAHLRPGNFSLRDAKDVYEVNKDLWIDSMEIYYVWPQVFKAELGDIPTEMKSPCCSTFMVSRERIRAHSVDFYVQMRDWIIRTEMSSYRAGRMMEYTWHIIFGEGPMMEAVQECELLYCDPGVPEEKGA